MIQTFKNLRENRPKLLEEGDLTSLKLHKRYHSLPNMSLQSISTSKAPQKTAALMEQVFSYLRENRPIIPVKGNDFKSMPAHRRCKSMPNIVFKSICVCHAPEAIPSVASSEIQVLADIPAAESTKSGVMTPVAVEANSIGSLLLPISSTLPPVQQVDSDGQQLLSSIPNVGIQLIGLSELKNSLVKPLEHETTGGLQDMVTRDGCGEAMETDTTVTAVRPRRRTLWSRSVAKNKLLFFFFRVIDDTAGTVCVLDSEQNDECIDFTMMCYFFCLPSPFGAVKLHRFPSTASCSMGK
ncbi:hypothetical protein QTP88_004324 [Uroleucon formosanum]